MSRALGCGTWAQMISASSLRFCTTAQMSRSRTGSMVKVTRPAERLYRDRRLDPCTCKVGKDQPCPLSTKPLKALVLPPPPMERTLPRQRGGWTHPVNFPFSRAGIRGICAPTPPASHIHVVLQV